MEISEKLRYACERARLTGAQVCERTAALGVIAFRI